MAKIPLTPSDAPANPLTESSTAHLPPLDPPPPPGVKRRRIRRWVYGLTLVVAALGVLMPVLAALGYKAGLLDLGTALGTMTRELTPPLLLGSGLLGLLSIALAYLVKPRWSGFWVGGLALVVAIAGMGKLLSVRATADRLPFIHDISTDTQDPPVFGDVIRGQRDAVEGVNTLDYLGKRDARDNRLVAALQTEAYPNVRPLVLDVPPGVAFERARAVAGEMGWAIAEADAGAGRMDTTDTTFWYGFQDDIAIRIRPSDGGGSLVDARSVSRVGGSDLGKNAERVKAFLAAMGD